MEFPEGWGVLEKIPSVGDVWIFSGTTHWSRSACSIAASTKSSGQEIEPALISANFSFPPQKPQKNKPTNFHQKYELRQLRFFRKIVNLFYNNMQARYPLLIKFCWRKTVKVYVQQGHTLDSKWSFFGSLVFDDAGKWANNTCVLFSSLSSLNVNQNWTGTLLKHH